MCVMCGGDGHRIDFIIVCFVLQTVYLSQVKDGMDLTTEEYRKCLQLLNGAILHNH